MTRSCSVVCVTLFEQRKLSVKKCKRKADQPAIRHSIKSMSNKGGGWTPQTGLSLVSHLQAQLAQNSSNTTSFHWLYCFTRNSVNHLKPPSHQNSSWGGDCLTAIHQNYKIHQICPSQIKTVPISLI